MSINLKFLSRRFLAGVLKANYALGNYRNVVWIIGDGRSGTTWVSRLINYRRRYREMFEPFHPEQVQRAGFLRPFEYVRPGYRFPQLEEFMDDIVSGKFSEDRVNRFNRSFFYNGILIKDIYANLLCFWACQRHPSIKPVLLLRNPFAVALSKAKKQDWLWVQDPMDLWDQEFLRQDYLLEHEDLIREISVCGDYIQKQLLIWSIINYVPLKQFKQGAVKVIHYEDVYTHPNREVSEVLRFINDNSKLTSVNLPARLINVPTRVAGKESTLNTNRSPISSWQDEVTTLQIDRGFQILSHFGLDTLYGDDGMPSLNNGV
ncbi:MAG: sulfotransferase domain-containing protein [bacterium]